MQKPTQILFYIFVTLFMLLAAFMPIKENHGLIDAIKYTLDAGHFIAFGILSLIIKQLISKHTQHPYRITLIVCGVLIVATELIQPLTGRFASLSDVFVSLLGVITFLIGTRILPQKKRLLSFSYMLISLLLFIGISLPAIDQWRAIAWRSQHFPQLGSFENELERHLWRASSAIAENERDVSFSSEFVSEGQKSLRFTTHTGSWSGISYAAGNKDWAPYKALELDLYNPGEPTKLLIRIDDDRPSPSYQQQFNAELAINSGWNQITISIDKIVNRSPKKPLNINKIHKLVLFSSKNSPSQLFYLDNVRLKQ